jgi:hypothetical protein
MEDYDVEAIAWKNAREEDLWIFDKLIVARKLGYVCGPAGMVVPKPDTYIVRPCVNIPGMGRGAEFIHIENDTKHLSPGHFWCEVFKGRHLSIDYKEGRQVLTVEGHRKSEELWRFSMWEKVDDIIPLPSIFYPLIKKYEYINIEYIDGNPIEIHLRKNPDFEYGNSIAIPVWKDEHISVSGNLRFVESPDYNRKGFYID